jgi:ADP-heptose:LPS heptosyltransferase
VRCYHGLGDTIQFARYLPALAKRCASVTVEVQPELEPLLSCMKGIHFVPFDRAKPQPPAERDIEIMELAFALRMSPREAPPPYLSLPALASGQRMIGLCPAASNWDLERCIPAELFVSICHNHDCTWLVPEPCALPVRNPEGCSLDILDSASTIASAALIITVDTMVAHLAGALGRPAWLLLKADPDWRWSLGRASPWYPSMRLYHQAAAGDWASVIAQVETDLARFPD